MDEIVFEPEAELDQYIEPRLTIYLSPTPLALPVKDWLTPMWTGEIKQVDEEHQERAAQLVSVGGEVLEFARWYRFVDATLHGETVSTRLPTPVLSTKPTLRLGETPLDGCRRLIADTKPICTVLSFLSRRHVNWTQVEFVSRGVRTDGKGYIDVEVRRSAVAAAPADRLEALVNPWRVPPGALDGLVANLVALPFRDAVESAVVYLLEAHAVRVVESELVSAFTALEAVTTGFADARGEDAILDTRAFKRLSKQLRGAIREFGSHDGHDAAVADSIIGKLPELNRPSFLTRVEKATSEYHVEWRDLWPGSLSISDALRPATRRRNELIHAGRLSGWLSVRDAVLIKALTERLLFAMLGADTEWLDPWAYRDALAWAVVPDTELE